MIRLSIESKLLAMLLSVSILSILAISLIAYSGGQQALSQAAYNQLISERSSKKTQIEDLFKTVRLQASNLADDRMVVDMMQALRKAAAELTNAEIQPAWDEKLTAYYRDKFLPQLEKTTGRKPIVDAYVPQAKLARYLQYWYDANNPFPEGEFYKLMNPGDGSAYSLVHEKYQGILAKYANDFGYSGIYLVDNRTADVLYTFGKTPVFGTNLLTGPYADTNAAELFRTLSHAKDQDIVDLVDFAAFAPAKGYPVAFAGAPIFDGADQIGMLFIQFPINQINRVMTGAESWSKEGLGRTGEVYLIGPDKRMRSRSRLLWEDPAAFYTKLETDGYSPEDIARVRRAGTATLSQRADTTSAEQALSGHEGAGVSTNYLGEEVLTAYAPLDIPGLHWAIAAEMQTREAFSPLYGLAERIMISAVIIILLVSVLAILLGRLFLRPVQRLIDRVHRMGAGTAALALSARSHDEFGDLAAAFDAMSQTLSSKAAELARKQRDYDVLLTSILPAPAAARLRDGQPPLAERFDDVSVLFAEVAGLTELTSSMSTPDSLGLLNDLVVSVDHAAKRNGVEMLRTVGGSYLVASGLPVQRLDHASRLVDFARDLLHIVLHLRANRGAALSVRIGIASGPVLAGAIGETRTTFDVLGEVVDLAKAITAVTKADVVAVSASCHTLVQDLYSFDPPTEITLQGRLATVWVLPPDSERKNRASTTSRQPEAPVEPERLHG